jgi:hypothetical protein
MKKTADAAQCYVATAIGSMIVAAMVTHLQL